MAQLFHDRKQRQERLSAPKSERAKLANIDYLRPIIADADTGHGGLTAVMKLTKLFAESVSSARQEIRSSTHTEIQGASAVHFEDQLHGGKKVYFLSRRLQVPLTPK